MNMQKHYVLAALTPTAYAAISSQMNMNHAVPMYRVSEVDARIAELEKALRWVIDNGSAPNHVPSDVARVLSELMVSAT